MKNKLLLCLLALGATMEIQSSSFQEKVARLLQCRGVRNFASQHPFLLVGAAGLTATGLAVAGLSAHTSVTPEQLPEGVTVVPKLKPRTLQFAIDGTPITNRDFVNGDPRVMQILVATFQAQRQAVLAGFGPINNDNRRLLLTVQPTKFDDEYNPGPFLNTNFPSGKIIAQAQKGDEPVVAFDSNPVRTLVCPTVLTDWESRDQHGNPHSSIWHYMKSQDVLREHKLAYLEAIAQAAKERTDTGDTANVCWYGKDVSHLHGRVTGQGAMMTLFANVQREHKKFVVTTDGTTKEQAESAKKLKKLRGRAYKYAKDVPTGDNLNISPWEKIKKMRERHKKEQRTT